MKSRVLQLKLSSLTFTSEMSMSCASQVCLGNLFPRKVEAVEDLDLVVRRPI